MDVQINPDMDPTWLRAVTHTVKTLSRIGETIDWHQARPNPDKMAIEQWQEVHADLTRQLVGMLAEAGVKLQIPDETMQRA